MSDINTLKDYLNKNGGPASSLVLEPASGHPAREVFIGMTIRDYFAGQALAGINANTTWDENGWVDRAKAAYSAADAMLAAQWEGGDE